MALSGTQCVPPARPARGLLLTIQVYLLSTPPGTVLHEDVIGLVIRRPYMFKFCQFVYIYRTRVNPFTLSGTGPLQTTLFSVPSDVEIKIKSDVLNNKADH